MKPLALDLFCGAGGVSMGLLRAGFEVIGVDPRLKNIARQLGKAANAVCQHVLYQRILLMFADCEAYFYEWFIMFQSHALFSLTYRQSLQLSD